MTRTSRIVTAADCATSTGGSTGLSSKQPDLSSELQAVQPIVTAAVYRGFGSELRLAASPSPYPSGSGQASVPIPPVASWQSPVFLVNSRLALFSAAPSGSTP